MKITLNPLVEIEIDGQYCSRYCDFLKWKSGFSCSLFNKKLQEEKTWQPIRHELCTYEGGTQNDITNREVKTKG